MRNIKLIISYDGSRYKGFQRLKDSENTVQGKIENVLTKMTGEQIEIIASGRTDMGVHAINQVANFHTNCNLSVKKIKNYLHEYLPEDIFVKEVTDVHERFHSRYNASKKIYLYKINNKEYNPFMRKYEFFIPKNLDILSMKKASEVLIGTHDFTSFASSKSKKKSHVRTINSIKINEINDGIDIFVEGDGFLYNMVRIIVGCLIDVGLGKIDYKYLFEVLESKDRKKASDTVPAKGLYLYKVYYE